MELLLALALIIYLLAEGATEGYTWAKPLRRKNNRLIVGRFDTAHVSHRGFLDYHSWRMIENFGILSTAGLAAFVGFSYSLLTTLAGGWLIGLFIYERTIDYIVRGKLFDDQKTTFPILGFEIPRGGRYWQYVVLLTGTALVLWGKI